MKGSLETILNNENLNPYHTLAFEYLHNPIINNILDHPGEDEYGITQNNVINNEVVARQTLAQGFL